MVIIATRFAEPWTIESLAREVGMSRSAFTAAFRELVGEAPARHLTGRRMQEAARLLAETTLPQSAVPERVGYHSAVGFHLAFRKWYGMTPGEYRYGKPLNCITGRFLITAGRSFIAQRPWLGQGSAVSGDIPFEERR